MTNNTTFLASRKKGVHYFGPTIDRDMSASEAFDLAGLSNWNVRKVALSTEDGLTVADHFATVASLRGGDRALGVVKGRYEPIQNEVLSELAQTVLDTGELVAEAVGMTHGGRRVFASFRFPEGVTVDGEEGGVDTSLFFSTSHDGSAPLSARVLHTRLVCTNQINGILSDKTAPQIKLRHTVAAATGRIQNVREALRIGWAARDTFASVAQQFAAASVTAQQFDDIVAGLFPIADDAAPAARTRAERRRDELRDVYDLSDTQQSIHGTAWGVVNAIVEWDDWVRSSRSDEARALGMLGGRDAAKRQGVLETVRVLDRPDLLALV
jgi:phage/plasmid-like protein (TIGR03299 family)